MAKELSKSRTCAAKCLYAAMQEMKKQGGHMLVKEIIDFLEKNINFTSWELERAGKWNNIRWQVMLQFYSIDYGYAGFIVKNKGAWYLTPEGENAMKLGATEMLLAANKAYKEKHGAELQKEVHEESIEEEATKMNLETLESDALEGIKAHILSKSPYDFQELVAALLRAMGYHTPFIAPKGKDGGIDIIAYLDPLGAQIPRIKVQVKRYTDQVVSIGEINGLAGVLKEGDIGLFVTASHFSPDARNQARNNAKFLRLLDIDEFIDMWTQYYDKMPDEDKNRLPLHRIAFLGSNE